MISILPQSTDTCLAVHFGGKVTGTEYQEFLDAVAERMKLGNPVSLVLELEELEFFGDFESARKDMKFGFGKYRHIQRAAFVGDQKWIEWFTRFIGPLTRAEERHFAAGQTEAAVEWASP
jgi:hypothetical protein